MTEPSSNGKGDEKDQSLVFKNSQECVFSLTSVRLRRRGKNERQGKYIYSGGKGGRKEVGVRTGVEKKTLVRREESAAFGFYL